VQKMAERVKKNVFVSCEQMRDNIFAATCHFYSSPCRLWKPQTSQVAANAPKLQNRLRKIR